MAIRSFFNTLFAGYVGHYPHNRIFLDRYYTDKKDERQKYDLVFPKNAKGDLGLVLCIHGGVLRRSYYEKSKNRRYGRLPRHKHDKLLRGRGQREGGRHMR